MLRCLASNRDGPDYTKLSLGVDHVRSWTLGVDPVTPQGTTHITTQQQGYMPLVSTDIAVSIQVLLLKECSLQYAQRLECSDKETCKAAERNVDSDVRET